MREKILSKAVKLFLNFGFKSVTMDQIAGEMCVSKKTIYKFFCNKEVLIKESAASLHKTIHESIDSIVVGKHNAIEENFEIRKMVAELFNAVDASPLYELKKYYSEIYIQIIEREYVKCSNLFEQNIQKGIREGLYRENLNIEHCVLFYYTLLFSISVNTSSEKELNKLELCALEYHIRAMATQKGIIELEKQLNCFDAKTIN